MGSLGMLDFGVKLLTHCRYQTLVGREDLDYLCHANMVLLKHDKYKLVMTCDKCEIIPLLFILVRSLLETPVWLFHCSVTETKMNNDPSNVKTNFGMGFTIQSIIEENADLLKINPSNTGKSLLIHADNLTDVRPFSPVGKALDVWASQ